MTTDYVTDVLTAADVPPFIATRMAFEAPESVAALHSGTPAAVPAPADTSEPSLNAAEAAFSEEAKRLRRREGFRAVQTTIPDALAVGLADSPAGLAAWLGGEVPPLERRRRGRRAPLLQEGPLRLPDHVLGDRLDRVVDAHLFRRAAGPLAARSGSADRGADDAQLMYERIPDATLVVVDGARHLPNLERPAEFNAALGRFLSSVPNTALTAQ